MTVDEIIKYVMNTPHNTNKAVLKPMLESLVREGGESPAVTKLCKFDITEATVSPTPDFYQATATFSNGGTATLLSASDGSIQIEVGQITAGRVEYSSSEIEAIEQMFTENRSIIFNLNGLINILKDNGIENGVFCIITEKNIPESIISSIGEPQSEEPQPIGR